MTAGVVLLVLLAATFGLGYLAGRRGLEDTDRGWTPPERRRWRP